MNRPVLDFLKIGKIYDIAKQCFLNEFVWAVTEQEETRVNDLIEKIKSGHINDDKDLAYFIPVIACYRPLFKTDIADLALSKKEQINRPAYTDLMEYSIEQPREELKIKDQLPSFGQIKDTTSKKVKQQYEDNPYPRWIYKGHKLIVKPSDEALEILVAGCGTGQVAICAAVEQPNCTITAIDLSLASLAHAQRVANDLGLTNIKYLNGDILDVEELGKTFDYIHCTGVLHHMKDPAKGWAKLTSVLNTGGLMSIGLYSKKARQAVTMVRNYIAENNIEYSPENLRDVREHIKSLDVDHQMLKVGLMGDFYTMSECRDLLFHVQEHQFTIPQIKDLLEDLNLEFLGFQKTDRRVEKFFKQHPGPAQHLDFELWDEFEDKNPLTFLGMYMINCRKK